MKHWLRSNALKLACLVIILAGTWLTMGLTDQIEQAKLIKELPGDDIRLIFRYGYGMYTKNELNTLNGTYTKDMVVDPPVTTHLSLSRSELDAIINKMNDINFFSYPDWFAVPIRQGGVVGEVTPFEGYYFKVEYSSGTKELYWDDNITNANADADKLRDLIQLIKGIVESKQEYQRLPAPRGGYD